MKLLEIQDVTVDFDGFKALNRLNFAMAEGELRVVIGPNGAGKTTFLDVITGRTRPTVGKVRFKGQDLTRSSEHRTANLGIGRKFQTPRVFSSLTVTENLLLSVKRSKGVLTTLFNPLPKAKKAKVADILARIGLAHRATTPAATLAHGERQWLEIGMLIAQDPALLLLDEPVAGLTDLETEQTARLLKDLQVDHSILVIEHDMAFVREIATTVSVFHQGSLLCEGSVGEVQNDPKVIEVYLGAHANA
ncbi:urea ABC transporter ATP-binding protein UrtD [Anthocerotibacter panamensis]|uniref:urea ABC transporter ATP-binding protein UrtD n=1 Tax=Anthocerotibacter panamensis TaxID=2857077 RepID=UPI001C405ABE|nr:urea ABC transporter ATP-binding protein UrtD [Anthocerotibacter panamensis]